MTVTIAKSVIRAASSSTARVSAAARSQETRSSAAAPAATSCSRKPGSLSRRSRASASAPASPRRHAQRASRQRLGEHGQVRNHGRRAAGQGLERGEAKAFLPRDAHERERVGVEAFEDRIGDEAEHGGVARLQLRAQRPVAG